MHNIKKLKIWNESINLCVNIYKALSKMPIDEKFGLSSQIKRAVVSISSNIAEGAGREREKEFYHFLNIAYGSSYELQTQLIICEKLGFISPDINQNLMNKLEEIQKMIYVFKENINKKLI